jgi:hypothetical protein
MATSLTCSHTTCGPGVVGVHDDGARARLHDVEPLPAAVATGQADPRTVCQRLAFGEALAGQAIDAPAVAQPLGPVGRQPSVREDTSVHLCTLDVRQIRRKVLGKR